MFGTQKILSELFAQINSYITKRAFAIDKVIKVVIYNLPFMVFVVHLLPEIFQEVSSHLVLVEEAEFLID